MAESIGLACGVLGVAMAFKGAVDTALMIESFIKSDCTDLALAYHIEQTRLWRWGELCKLDNPTTSSFNKLSDRLLVDIARILGEIKRLNARVQELAERHNVETPNIQISPGISATEYTQPECRLVRVLSKHLIKPTSRFLWVIKGRDEFGKLVTDLRRLIVDLHDFSGISTTPGAGFLQDTLVSYALSPISNPDLLRALTTLRTSTQNMAHEAALKLQYFQAVSKYDAKLPVEIAWSRLRLINGGPIGVLKSIDGSGTTLVWVEWNVFGVSSNVGQYQRRIAELAFNLVQLSDPALRLPPCHGIYNDLNYEAYHEGAKRIGFVFSVPSTASVQSPYKTHPGYEGDLKEYPHVTLTELIRDLQKQSQMPPLGDRFRLAYALALAFFRFHNGGWLHKGFHTGNIIFFRRKRGDINITSQPQEPLSILSNIDITEPFITGFQYSRPEDEESHSRSPLEDSAYAHYYHPDLESGGFSRPHDAYSLGIVLCEISLWCLIRDPKAKDRKSRDRSAWRDKIHNEIINNMGWRMGTRYQSVVRTLISCELPDGKDDVAAALYTREFDEKVLRPLSECAA